ncbi:MAG TPA: IclR family transcriptional regulator C-terminal domain-containing protein [Acidimicrobiales bacterium]
MEQSVSGVGVLDKAVSILAALEAGPCSLAGVVEATGLTRATAHRLAGALEVHGFVGRDTQGRYAVGPRVAGLGLAAAARPALEVLRDATGESVQLFVRRGAQRICILALESPHGLRTIVPVGAVLPLERGSAGAVLRDDLQAGRRGWAQSVGEREAGVASVSAPVRRLGRTVAAVSVSGPIERTTRSPGKRFATDVVRAARSVEAAMGWAP